MDMTHPACQHLQEIEKEQNLVLLANAHQLRHCCPAIVATNKPGCGMLYPIQVFMQLHCWPQNATKPSNNATAV